MALITNSIQKKKSKGDGIRICIMRRPNKNAIFDIWMPVLSPSNKLLTDYKTNKINWSMMKKKFKKEIKKQYKFIKLLTEIALKNNVTILCWEKRPDKCHRILVAEQCLLINPNLKTLIK
jgi:uncharacterized protein YeaO (DUF488 family)